MMHGLAAPAMKYYAKADFWTHLAVIFPQLRITRLSLDGLLKSALKSPCIATWAYSLLAYEYWVHTLRAVFHGNIGRLCSHELGAMNILSRFFMGRSGFLSDVYFMCMQVGVLASKARRQHLQQFAHFPGTTYNSQSVDQIPVHFEEPLVYQQNWYWLSTRCSQHQAEAPGQ